MDAIDETEAASVPLGEAFRRRFGDVRTARVVYASRKMGRIYYARDVERRVRSSLWIDRAAEHHYDALEWFYGWTAERCLR